MISVPSSLLTPPASLFLGSPKDINTFLSLSLSFSLFFRLLLTPYRRMMYSSPDYTWEHHNFDTRPHHAQHLKYPPHSPSARPTRRRRRHNSYTKPSTQQTYSPTLSQELQYGRSPCFIQKDHLNVPHGPYWTCGKKERTFVCLSLTGFAH